MVRVWVLTLLCGLAGMGPSRAQEWAQEFEAAESAGLRSEGAPGALGFNDDDFNDDDDDEPKVEIKAPFDNLAIPDTLEAAARERFEEALGNLRQLVENRGGDEGRVKRDFRTAARALKGEALVEFWWGRYELWDEDGKNARKRFEEAIEINPNFYEAYAYLGDVYFEENELEDARECYDKALEIFPAYEYGLMSKYGYFLVLGQFEEARGILATLGEVSEAEWVEQADKFLEKTMEPPAWPKEFVAETDNYVVRTGVSQDYAEMVANCAEQIRKLYGKYFFEIDRVGRKYQIFVYRTKNEYHAHGGPRTAGGHYQPYTRCLYLYKYKKHSDTMLVLYHEGFHQYLHEHLQTIPQWFNEGLGDFFGGAMISRDGRKAKMGPNPWRVDYVRQAIQANRVPTAEKLMQMSREEMYGRNAGIHYAQAWAIVYYCLEGGQSKHKKAIQNYFRALCKGRSQREAYLLSFANVDMERFERDWRNFIDRQPSRGEVEAIREAL